MNENEQGVVVVKVELEIGKESKEVADCVAKIIEDIKAGKPVGEVATGNLQGLYAAIDGFDKLDDEAKHISRNATGAYASYKLAEALAPVK